MEDMDIVGSVYYKEINCEIKYKKGPTQYNSIFSNEEIELLMDIYKRNTNIFNGTVIRLDKITFDEGYFSLNISKIKYFDLLTSNIFNHTPEKWFEKCKNRDEIYYCENKYANIKKVLKKHESFEDVINNRNISSVIAISVLIKDKNHEYGLTKRSKNLTISTSFFNTSVTGDVDEEDFKYDDPLFHCAKREIFEELGITINEIKLRGIAISKSKLQPVILFDATINDEWETLIKKIKLSRDFKMEIEKFFIVSKKEIPQILKDGEFTDATRYHIYLNYIEN